MPWISSRSENSHFEKHGKNEDPYQKNAILKNKENSIRTLPRSQKIRISKNNKKCKIILDIVLCIVYTDYSKSITPNKEGS